MKELLQKVLGRYSKYIKENPYQRKGQALFNILYEEDMELADEIRGTGLDPFHNDEIVNIFIIWLADK